MGRDNGGTNKRQITLLIYLRLVWSHIQGLTGPLQVCHALSWLTKSAGNYSFFLLIIFLPV